jgi:hypothetical protein
VSIYSKNAMRTEESHWSGSKEVSLGGFYRGKICTANYSLLMSTESIEATVKARSRDN